MRLRKIQVALLLLIGLSLGAWVYVREAERVEAPRRVAGKPSRSAAAPPARGAPASPPHAVSVMPSAAPTRGVRPEAAPASEVLEILSTAATTYDPAELPTIEPYLADPDPEIRQAAVDSMMILGDAAAAPLLRAAAASSPTPAEAENLLKAAAYLELPARRTRPAERE